MSITNAYVFDKDQIRYLAEQPELCASEDLLWRVQNFEMPSQDELVNLVIEKYPDKSIKMGYGIRDVKYTYRYYQGYTFRLRRRLMRYMAIYLSTTGLLNMKVIDTNIAESLKQDLKAVDIDLLDQASVKSGRARIAKSFVHCMKLFASYADKAILIDTYTENRMMFNPLDPGITDDERFGPEMLCIDNWMLYCDECENDYFVQPSEKQREKMKARFAEKMKDASEALEHKLGNFWQ